MRYTQQYFSDIKKTMHDFLPVLSNIDQKKILITGANGLIGSALVDCLIYLNLFENFHIEIYAATRNVNVSTNRFHTNFELPFLHFVVYDAMAKFESSISYNYIIHCAGNAHPDAYRNEPVETMLANILGLNELLNYGSTIPGLKTLYISSSEVYGNNCKNISWEEDSVGDVEILNPRSCYPMSKRASETLCSSYIKEFNSDIVIARPGHIYGPTMTESDSRASAQFLRNAKCKNDIVMKSAGTQLRSYCHALDCASALLVILLRGICGEAYNISNRSSVVTIRYFAEVCAKQSGTKVIFEKPTDAELSSYNQMDHSDLNSEKLEMIGWHGVWGIEDGIGETLSVLS